MDHFRFKNQYFFSILYKIKVFLGKIGDHDIALVFSKYKSQVSK